MLCPQEGTNRGEMIQWWCRSGLVRIIIVNEMLLRTGACLDQTRGSFQLLATDD